MDSFNKKEVFGSKVMTSGKVRSVFRWIRVCLLMKDRNQQPAKCSRANLGEKARVSAKQGRAINNYTVEVLVHMCEFYQHFCWMEHSSCATTAHFYLSMYYHVQKNEFKKMSILRWNCMNWSQSRPLTTAITRWVLFYKMIFQN